MEILIIAVLGILAIVGASALGSKLGVAAPLLLVVAGIAVSLLPFVPEIEIEPEWILAGVLPPLLYSASVSMPTMDFRREFSAISGLSIALVVISAVLLGLFFAWLIPGLGLWWGIALGAIVSPTDAVATSIVKKVGVSPRVVSILEGESLLNDATALVLLRTAIAGAAASVSLWGALGDFAFAVLVAVAIGAVVGWGNLRLRSRVSDVTVNTVLSFTVPFLASIPAELLGASGLVAAVTAGLITGHGAPRRLSPQARLSDKQNWKSIELVLEGAVFLTMGLEMAKILTDVNDDHAGVGPAVGIAAGALMLTVLIRAGFVAPLLVLLHRRARRGEAMKDRIESIQDKLADPEAFAESVRARTEELRAGREQGELRERRGGPNATFEDRIARSGGFGAPLAERVERWQTRFRRASADIDYLLASPLGWREGTVVVWAGMRGAVTVAAAQTLPQGTPNRSLLILIAFLVAAGSLLIQGGTIKRIVAWLKPRQGDDGDQAEERRRIMELLAEAGASVHEEKWQGVPTKKMLLEVIAAQRSALLDARDDGLFTSEVLSSALAVLDADQIRIELRGGPEG